MSVHNFKVTIGSGPTRFTSTRTPVRQLTLFNTSATNDMWVGDSTTTSTGTTGGVKLVHGTGAGQSFNTGPFVALNTNLEDWYVAGTAADVLAGIYIV